MNTSDNISLDEAIETLGMGKDSQGLRWVSEKGQETDEYIYMALEQAERFDAKAVYFRFFSDPSRPPKPQIYIYHFSDILSDSTSASNIHHHLWNAGVVPYCFIFQSSQIHVYNCGLKPQWNTEGDFITSAHDTINLLSDVQEKIQQYHARQFDSGLFWDSEISKNFKYGHSAYEQLLTQLKNAKTQIIERVGRKKAVLVKRILMMLILLKYLEERQDETGKGALNPEEFYKEYNPKNPTLEGVLNSAESLTGMLNKLSSEKHFNGQIFYLTQDELNDLKQIDLTVFQFFVRGDANIFPTAKYGMAHLSIWKLYQFNYLPIELISHIYEDFLADENGVRKKGVVYTPPYLVQFLIDRTMPLNDPKEQFKVLDPACGSGIFLVGAYKRMIQWWRVRNNWKKPTKNDVGELKALLKNNIYGCDLEEEAVTLTYFSLGLSLLDALSPKEIWENVHFDNLINQNLIAADFFKTLSEEKLDVSFNLVIGNPPFEEKYTDWAITVDNRAKGKDQSRPAVPQNQIALLFLEQSFKLLKEGGNTCLILPSGPVLYNTKVHGFRNYLFEKNYFKAIFDFTPLRAKLFIGSSSSAKPPVVAVFAEKSSPEARPIQHLIFRRTRASSEKIEFEIDHYDIHWTSYQRAQTSPDVWQANFMGGGRLHQIAEKLTGTETLKDFLKRNHKNRNWVYGEGWQECPDSKPLTTIKKLLAKSNISENEQKELNILESKHKAEWITGKKFIDTNGEISICTTTFFQWPRKKSLFEPPHLIVHEHVKGGKIPTYLRNDYVTFKDSLFGIHAPSENVEELQKIQRFLADEANVGLIWLKSGKVITMREGVPLMTDILSLPFPNIELNQIERVLLSDVSNFLSAFRKEGEKSDILNPASQDDLRLFGKMYCKILNSIYDNFMPLAPVVGNEFIAYPFILGSEPEMEIPNTISGIEGKLKSLIDHQVSYNLWVKRIIRVYHKNVIILYKPNQKRYWLRSIAVRDADETFNDLYLQGK